MGKNILYNIYIYGIKQVLYIIPYLFCEVPNWSLLTESLSRPRHPAEFPSSVVDQWGVRARSAVVNSDELLHWEKSWRRTKDEGLGLEMSICPGCK